MYCCKTDVSQRSLATIRSIAGFMSFKVYSYGSKISMQHAADRIVLFIDRVMKGWVGKPPCKMMPQKQKSETAN